MSASIVVFLCTYNGEKYLHRQLDSVVGQQGMNVRIIAHDDGSKDNSVNILNEYNIPVMGGEHLGAAHGFFYLMEQAPEADFYAFCDQDDIWDSDKLKKAADALEAAAPEGSAALYACSTRLVNDSEEFISLHKIDKNRSLTSRLFYASISGNTIVFNKKMRDIAVMHHPEEMVMHDSWMVKLCIATGGHLVIDEEPHMDYRMHGNNVVGMELNFSQKVGKFKKVVKGRGEGQELIDICNYYGSMVPDEYRKLAADTLLTRTDKRARRGFVKKYGIDFKSRGFDAAFAMKVSRGNL